jgi:alkanesulfonate monooxygenase SsuD/methylene tetrahydromethanopterin reductase-like flavin-dependent oxidoreductase (luciferase family)
MKDYRDDVRAQMRTFGRDPDSCKILFMACPVLGETTEDARAKAAQRTANTAANVDRALAQLGWVTNIDFSGHDLDAPVDSLTTNGHQSSLAGFIRKAGGKTLREAIVGYSSSPGSLDLIGTCDEVAAQMEEAMQEVGGDGFLFTQGNMSRRSIAEICDGLIPALQQRGLVRKQYGKVMFRDNLLEY